LWNGSRSRKNPDDTLVDRLLRHVADDLVGDLAVFKEQQRRNTSDAIARGSLAVLVNVQLQDLQLAFVACCYLLYDRLLGLQHIIVKSCIAYVGYVWHHSSLVVLSWSCLSTELCLRPAARQMFVSADWPISVLTVIVPPLRLETPIRRRMSEKPELLLGPHPLDSRPADLVLPVVDDLHPAHP
jgi:hypothetical protein